MNFIDLFLFGAIGGFVSSALFALAFLGQVKWSYDKKLQILAMKIMNLEIAIGNDK